MDRLAALLAGSVSAAAPLAVAALGGLMTAQAGSLSVALEGSMLAGAFAAAAVAHGTGNLAVALLAALAAGALLSLIVGAAAEGLGADVFVAGLAANILAPGAVSMISQAVYGTKGVLPAESLRIASILPEALSGVPVFGRALFGQGGLVYLLAFAALLLALAQEKSAFGLRLRAAGESPEVARAAGLEPRRYRIAAHIVSGAASGLAGAALASQVAAFVPGITAGRGWIALVAVYLGGRKAGGVAAACLGFGFLIAFSNAAQGGSSARSWAQLLQALPYLATALALIVWRKAAKSREGRHRWRD